MVKKFGFGVSSFRCSVSSLGKSWSGDHVIWRLTRCLATSTEIRHVPPPSPRQHTFPCNSLFFISWAISHIASSNNFQPSTSTPTQSPKMSPTDNHDDANNPPINFHHPYTPYDVQLKFMRAVYSVLETGNGQVGILESPTGTVTAPLLLPPPKATPANSPPGKIPLPHLLHPHLAPQPQTHPLLRLVRRRRRHPRRRARLDDRDGAAAEARRAGARVGGARGEAQGGEGEGKGDGGEGTGGEEAEGWGG